jgi:hypothetical protein
MFGEFLCVYSCDIKDSGHWVNGTQNFEGMDSGLLGWISVLEDNGVMSIERWETLTL